MSDYVQVSIHAPGKGATLIQLYVQRPGTCFNPRAREGRDKSIGSNLLAISAFQSTRPGRARRLFRRVAIDLLCFNPRAREGRDFCCSIEIVDCKSFNPRAREGRDMSRLLFLTGL